MRRHSWPRSATRASSLRSGTTTSASQLTVTTRSTTWLLSSPPSSGTALCWRSDSISAMPRMNKGALERLQERIRTADRGWFFAAVADKVAERRQARGLSQRELAELVGTTQSAIARLERGGRPPRIDTLLRIADALECDLVVDLRPRRH